MPPAEPRPPVSALLRQREVELTPAEARIAQTLLAEYPMAGLGTVANLARRAGVSDPTVVRLVAKLGFSGYPAFQKALLGEVEARLHSPLLMMETQPPPGTAAPEGQVAGYLHSLESGLAALAADEAALYQRAASLLADRRLRVSLLGGRFSRYLAGILSAHLAMLRPDVRHLDGTAAEMADAPVDLGRRDLLVVFDYRRYQADTVDFATRAAARGAKVMLFTDPYRSPIAEVAQLVLTATVQAGSPSDTLVPALAQVEALLACLLEARDKAMLQRLQQIEALRAARGVTLG